MAGFSIVVISLIMIAIYFTIIAILAAIDYLLTAISVFRVARRMRTEHAFLAWIPIAQSYLYAKLIGKKIQVGRAAISQFPWIYMGIVSLGGIVSSVIQSFSPFSFISMLLKTLANGAISASDLALLPGIAAGLALFIVIQIVRIFTMYRVFKLFKGKTVLCTILGAVIPFAQQIILLVIGGRPFAEEPEAVPEAVPAA